jgi:hypothetical protein
VEHFGTEESPAQLADRPQPGPGRELLELAGIEVEEAQRQLLGPGLGAAHQGAPGPELYFARLHLHLDLHRVAGAGIAQRSQLRLVLVTQRQVQRQVEGGAQPELVELLAHGCGNVVQERGAGGQRGRGAHVPRRVNER